MFLNVKHRSRSAHCTPKKNARPNKNLYLHEKTTTSSLHTQCVKTTTTLEKKLQCNAKKNHWKSYSKSKKTSGRILQGCSMDNWTNTTLSHIFKTTGWINRYVFWQNQVLDLERQGRAPESSSSGEGKERRRNRRGKGPRTATSIGENRPFLKKPRL